MIRGLLAFSIAVSWCAAFAQEPSRIEMADAPPIFRKALFAVRHVNYIGTRTVEFRRNGVIVRHEETITRMGTRVRIDFPEGSPEAGQVIVESAGERRHYFPATNEIHILPPRHEEAFERLARVLAHGKRHISMSTAPGQSVAGLRTEQLAISDQDGNVVQRLYIDPESGLILKRQLFDSVGTQQGGFEYSRVQISPDINPAIFAIHHNGARIMTPADLLERLAAKSGFLPVALPLSSGFRLEGSSVRKIQGSQVLLETYGGHWGKHLTLFQLKEFVSPDRMKNFAERQELRFVYWTTAGTTFVLVGNIDVSSLLAIASPVSGGTATTGG